MMETAAAESLPDPLRSYFRQRRAYLLEHAVDPDRLARDFPEERPHHYTEIEAYDVSPFVNFQRWFIQERANPAPAKLQHGDSILEIERRTLRLEAAFRRHRWNEVDRAAVMAAHYAGDLTQPLHTVMNHDGQLTNQRGIHRRFEVDLVNALASGWRLQLPAPVYESDLRARIFHELATSYSYQNVLFGADRIALDSRASYDSEYSQTFCTLAGPLARKRLEAGAWFIGSLWYTAWVRAQKPALPGSFIPEERREPAGAVR